MVVFRFCPKFMGGGGDLRKILLLFNEKKVNFLHSQAVGT